MYILCKNVCYVANIGVYKRYYTHTKIRITYVTLYTTLCLLLIYIEHTYGARLATYVYVAWQRILYIENTLIVMSYVQIELS